MANQFEVIDADGHITETDAQLKKYMSEKYVKRVSTLTLGDSWDRSLSGKLGTRAGDAKSWLAAIDRGGVSTAVLYPTNGLSIGWIREPSTAGRIYSYVACMMAGGRNTYCEFSEQIPGIPEITLDPGSPRGGYVTLPAGETDLQRIAYKRTFQKAIMYLNPTYSDITADGITIPAKTGLVLPPPPRR